MTITATMRLQHRCRRMLGSGREQRMYQGPWFRSHLCLSVAVIAVSSIGVLIFQILDTRGSDAIALLYVLPISLASVSFGLRGGLISAAYAYLVFALFTIWASSADVGPDGWISRAAAMFLLGGLLGAASDQIDRATRMALAQERVRLVIEEENRRFSEGLELSDGILQQVAVAKWLAEQGKASEAAELLLEALGEGQQMIGELLPTRSARSRS